jgi:hypothetical protein
MIFRKLPHVADYPETVMRMETHVDHMLAGFASEEVWLLEHPNIYTLGSSAKDSDVLSPDLLPLYRTGRGGQVTYHGTGQRIAYVMIDLSQRKQDLHWYVQMLEEWLIMTLKDLGIKGERRRERVGIWVSDEKGREQKVAAIGVRVKILFLVDFLITASRRFTTGVFRQICMLWMMRLRKIFVSYSIISTLQPTLHQRNFLLLNQHGCMTTVRNPDQVKLWTSLTHVGNNIIRQNI